MRRRWRKTRRRTDKHKKERTHTREKPTRKHDNTKSKIAEELRETVWPLLDTQKIRVHIDSIFPLEKFKDAHIRMENGNHMGKIILSLD